VALVRDNDEKATLSSPFASTSPITLDFPTATLTVFREKYTRMYRQRWNWHCYGPSKTDDPNKLGLKWPWMILKGIAATWIRSESSVSIKIAHISRIRLPTSTRLYVGYDCNCHNPFNFALASNFARCWPFSKFFTVRLASMSLLQR